MSRKRENVRQCKAIRQLIDDNKYTKALELIDAIPLEEVGSLDDLYRYAELYEKAERMDKKKEIFECLAGVKEEKVVKKSEENLKLDLKNEYVGDESTDNKSDKKLKYIGIAAVIVVIIGAGVMVKKYRRR